MPHVNMPAGSPIRVYRNVPFPIWVVVGSVTFIIIFLVLITPSQNWAAGNLLVALVALVLIRSGGIYWNNLRTKVERYPDALILYSTSEHNTFYFNDIVGFSSESIEMKNLSRIQYTLQRSDGMKMSFPSTLQGIEELVGILESEVGEPKTLLVEAIEKLERGDKIVISQFTLTKDGITAENGEFRTWSDIDVDRQTNSKRLVFKERSKPAVIGRQAVWSPLPKQNATLLAQIVAHFQTSE